MSFIASIHQSFGSTQRSAGAADAAGAAPGLFSSVAGKGEGAQSPFDFLLALTESLVALGGGADCQCDFSAFEFEAESGTLELSVAGEFAAKLSVTGFSLDVSLTEGELRPKVVALVNQFKNIDVGAELSEAGEEALSRIENLLTTFTDETGIQTVPVLKQIVHNLNKLSHDINTLPGIASDDGAEVIRIGVAKVPETSEELLAPVTAPETSEELLAPVAAPETSEEPLAPVAAPETPEDLLAPVAVTETPEDLLAPGVVTETPEELLAPVAAPEIPEELLAPVAAPETPEELLAPVAAPETSEKLLAPVAVTETPEELLAPVAMPVNPEELPAPVAMAKTPVGLFAPVAVHPHEPAASTPQSAVDSVLQSAAAVLNKAVKAGSEAPNTGVQPAEVAPPSGSSILNEAQGKTANAHSVQTGAVEAAQAEELTVEELVARIREITSKSAGDKSAGAAKQDADGGDADIDAPGVSASARGGDRPGRLFWSALENIARSDRAEVPSFVRQLQGVADFLAARVDGTFRIGAGLIEADLELHPPDLGRVRVELAMSESGAVKAVFRAELPETQRLLERNLQQFTQALKGQGLTVDNVRVVPEITAHLGTLLTGEDAGEGERSADERRGQKAEAEKDQPQSEDHGRREDQEFDHQEASGQ